MSVENYRGPATIRQAGRDIAVACEYRSERDRIFLDDIGAKWIDGLARWRGSISCSDAPFTLEDATLTLPTGESAPIILTVSYLDTTLIGSVWAQSIRGSFEFVGTGAPPS